jgi:hypothetical protein
MVERDFDHGSADLLQPFIDDQFHDRAQASSSASGSPVNDNPDPSDLLQLLLASAKLLDLAIAYRLVRKLQARRLTFDVRPIPLLTESFTETAQASCSFARAGRKK